MPRRLQQGSAEPGPHDPKAQAVNQTQVIPYSDLLQCSMCPFLLLLSSINSSGAPSQHLTQLRRNALQRLLRVCPAQEGGTAGQGKGLLGLMVKCGLVPSRAVGTSLISGWQTGDRWCLQGPSCPSVESLSQARLGRAGGCCTGAAL